MRGAREETKRHYSQMEYSKKILDKLPKLIIECIKITDISSIAFLHTSKSCVSFLRYFFKQ